MFLDGVVVSEASAASQSSLFYYPFFAGSASGTNPSNYGGGVAIGRDGDFPLGPLYPFTGSVDEVAVYGSVLSGPQVQQHWRDGRKLARRYVALGDSYSSGEGTGDYIPPTDQRSPQTDLCHRSPHAHSQVVQPLDVFGRPMFSPAQRSSFACSGARIKHVRSGVGARQYEPENSADNRGQLDHGELTDADLVSMTIGGNDVGFSSILTTCLWRTDCTGSRFRIPGTQLFGSVRPSTLRKIDAMSQTLGTVYGDVKTASPRAVHVALDYPQLFPGYPQGNVCAKFGNPSGAVSYNGDEQAFFREATARLSTVTQSAALASGWLFASTLDAFAGHEVCGTANNDWLFGFKGPVGLSLKPESGSFHPNLAGQDAYASVLRNVAEPALTNTVTGAAARSSAATVTTSAPALEPNEVDIEWGTDLATIARDQVAAGCEVRYEASQWIVVRGDGYAPGTAIEISFDSNATDEQLLTTVNADTNGSFRADVRIPTTATPQAGQGLQAVGAGTGGQVRVAYGEFIIDPVGGPCTPTSTAGSVWATATQGPTLVVNGSGSRIDLPVRVRGGVTINGANHAWTAGLIHQGTLVRNGTSTITPAPLNQPIPTYPQPDITVWRPGGSAAVAAGAAYSAVPASQCTGGSWNLPAITTTPIVYVPCAVNINGSNSNRTVTIIADGAIRVNGSGHTLHPAPGTDIALLSATGGITINGSTNTILGSLQSGATLAVNGSNNTFSCGITASTITLNGSGHTITATCPTTTT